MAESNLPNPSSTIVYFLLTTICFAFFTIYNIFQKQEISQITEATNNNVINFVYILLLVVGSYFINASISKSMCSQSIQWSYVLMITLLPWIIIFISLYFVLKIFPGWITPFSNTIGYSVIGLLGIEKTYDDIFISTDEANSNTELVKAIANMNSNKPKFINQISIDIQEFVEFFTQMGQLLKKGISEKVNEIQIPEQITNLTRGEGMIDTGTKGKGMIDTGTEGKGMSAIVTEGKGISTGADEEVYGGRAFASKARNYLPKKTHMYKKNFKGGGPEDLYLPPSPPIEPGKPTKEPIKNPIILLYQLLVIKQLIGKLVWYVLAGILISSISYNLVINMACEKSLEEIKKDFETAREEQSTAAQSNDVSYRASVPTRT
jgi:hypothetical protein